ncbi:MAG TPA: polysaccharide deacetylase family protein [Candidatus Saccharimonadales bacterium]
MQPQFIAGVLALALVVVGYIISPKVIRPSQVAAVPVIQPIVSHVESATVQAPVDCAKVACLALTFDDGPSPAITPQVLDILDRHNAKATFFLIGVHVSGNEEIVRRMHQSGHEIGNHTWSHRNLAQLSPQELKDDIARAQSAITAAGVPAPRLFRAPYGKVDPMVLGHVPMSVVSWNIDPEDWKPKGPEKVVEHVLAHAKPGGIVDLHDIYQSTADSLDPMLTSLEQTYHLVTVSELLNLPAGQPGVFYGR